jgi:large subunit ribosomal protein L29
MMATAAEIRALSDGEIEVRLVEAKEELFNLRFQMASGQLENSSRIKVVRRKVARLLTIERERQLARELLQEEENA